MRKYTALALCFLTLFWAYFLFVMPTFDFDESLYRRVAEGMKAASSPWVMTWDGQPLFHKPPLFYWLIVAVSRLLDPAEIAISSTAARIPSLLASLGILFSLRKFLKPGSGGALAFVCGSFLLLTSAAVIFDPLQTLALMPALLIPARAFRESTLPSAKGYLLVGLSLALATSIKGLNGLIIPAFAIGLHLLLHLKSWGFKKFFREGLRFKFLAFFPAVLLASAFFFWMDQKLGRGFTNEFFWVQHFGRSKAPMEAHAGGPWYHPLVLWIGGGFLSALIANLASRRKISYLRMGYPLTFALSFVLVFSLSATKLPHYLWPAWPALAIFAGMIAELPATRPAPRLAWRLVFQFPVVILSALVLALGAVPLSTWVEILSPWFQSKAALSTLHAFPALGLSERLALLLSAFVGTVFVLKPNSESDGSTQIARTAAYSAAFALGLVVGLGPALRGLLVEPFYAVAGDIHDADGQPSDCIRYTGPLSATLSLALGTEFKHNQCNDNATPRFLITPDWKTPDCASVGMRTVSRHGQLWLCEGGGQRMLHSRTE